MAKKCIFFVLQVFQSSVSSETQLLSVFNWIFRPTKMLTFCGQKNDSGDFRCLSWCHCIYFIMFLSMWLWSKL